ncbi:hypothetical protein M902_0844 [Bacteriovorax sp. BAL6_X]|uniref:hypothetical protein n=1 Tax=Bacteriovorax sp. BAL6_X TaxID=1201290 RepID=UPI0003861D16|nr:hypothetical protein [Bacteriovorax sp. BAL6_X]EPZ49331.1 hypothetical protein M902_0844 [Bacteriovorax sp. BAL6_X]
MIIQFSKLLLALLFSSSIMAGFKAQVITRDGDMDLVKKEVELDLTNTSLLENRNFKIVYGKSNEAINLGTLEDEVEKLRAASVFYHLTKAKSYFLNVVKSTYVKELPQLVVRLNITNQFNSIGHFAHDNLSPEYNNALSIPPGKGRARFGIKPWNYEIWFRPAKEIDLPKEGLKNDFEQTAAIFKEFRNQSRLASFQQFVSDLFLLTGDALKESGLSILGSTAIIEASFFAMKKLYGLLQGKKFFLDTSFIPEVVYHEFAHVALSDHLGLSHSSPVNEGMADFFAASIADSATIADNVKDYAKRVREKDAFRDEIYNASFETNAYANIDFVLGVLWQVRELDKESSHGLIYDVRKNITSSSNIRGELLRSIFKECRRSCKSPLRDRINLQNAYHEMGL